MRDVLAKYGRIASLRADEESAIRNLALNKRHYAAGTNLVTGELDEPDQLFIVERGRLFASVDLPGGERAITRLYFPGDIVGTANIPFDRATHTVTVSSTAATRDSQPARLRVLTPAEYANWLDNPSFETDVEQPWLVPPPWFNFSGAALASTNDFYGNQIDYPVQAKDGTNVVRIYTAGEWNGVFQDQPAAPGDIFTADGWFWLSSQDALAGNTSLQIEVQFRAGPVPLAMWVSAPVNQDSPRDQWLYLEVTNGVPAGWTQISTENARYLVAPPGTETVRFQLTLHNQGGGTGNVYADALRLMKKERVRITARRVGNEVELSWPTQGATQYQVIATEDLAQPVWAPVGSPVEGDGSVKAVRIPLGPQSRFFQVLTL